MKNAIELYEEWNNGEETGMRPKRVQALRDDIAEATGMTIPHRVPEIEGWLEAMHGSGVLTKKLRAAAEAQRSTSEPSDEDGDTDEDEQ